MIKIIVIGPEQSGSTRLYNFIVNIYKIQNLKVLCGWDINISEYNNNSNYDVIVSKLHEYKSYDLFDRKHDQSTIWHKSFYGHMVDDIAFDINYMAINHLSII